VALRRLLWAARRRFHRERSERLVVTMDQGAGIAVVTARGEVDLDTASLLDAALREALDTRSRLLVVDLAGVTFLSSSGLAALLSCRRLADREHVHLRLAGCGAPVLKPLRAANIDGRFERYPSAVEAEDEPLPDAD
jgi:anti-anti-sigma factor